MTPSKKPQQFFALVGPEGSGKSTILHMLEHVLNPKFVVFLCDSSKRCTAPHVRFTERVSQITGDGAHLHADAHTQLMLFWTRLRAVIKGSVKPSLENGKTVIIDGFGGTILANARMHAQPDERDGLLDLHKDMIKHHVVGQNVPPPLYLHFKPSPEVAFERILSMRERAISEAVSADEREQRIAELREVTLAKVSRLNAEFEFYGSIPGQKVITIDANKPLNEMFSEVLKHIEAALETEVLT